MERHRAARHFALLGLALSPLAACASSGAGDVPVGAGRDVTTTATGHIQDLSFRSITDEQATEGVLLEAIDDVWVRLPDVFAELEVEVTHSDPTSHAMGNRGFRVRRIGGERPAEYLDCGYGSTAQPYANSYEVTMGLMVVLTAAEEGGTKATVRVDATAKPRAVSGHAVPCSTKRTLERRILTTLQLVRPPGS